MLKRTVSGLSLFVFGLTSIFAAAQARQFLQSPQYSTGANSNPQAFAIADFNNDGIPDVAVANSGTNAVSIFLGNGDGTFKQVNCGGAQTCPTGNNPQGIAAADFNHDGNVDLAVTNYNSNTITILFGNGSGQFTVQSVAPATGANPRGIAVADFNQDGYPDIVITNSGSSSSNVGLFINNGSGGFGPQATYSSGFSPWAVAVGDFNNDKVPDIVVANYNNNNELSVYLGTGSKSCQTSGQSCFGSQFPAFTGTQNQGSPVSVAVGDFNGDGNLDIAAAVQGDGVPDTVAVLLGKGNGGFDSAVAYTTASFPIAVAAADLNGDGNLDLAVAAADGNVVTVFWGNGTGVFGGQVNCGTGDIPSSVAVANLTNAANGQNDLIVSNGQGNSFSVIINNGNETFQSRLDYVAGPNAHSVVAADFNGDGIPDLVFADGAGSEISLTLGNGDGTFQPPSYFTTGTSTDPAFIVEGDFNLDGVPDVAVANYATSTISVFLGQRTKTGDTYTFTFPTRTDYPVGNQNLLNPDAEPTSIAIGDFNGDGYPDLAVTNYNENSVTILLNAGKSNPGAFVSAPNCEGSTQNACPVGSNPIDVAVGNFNGNQNLDLVVINESSNNATILLGNGDGTFTAQPTPTAVGGNPLAVAVADLNGDGILDLAVADFQTQQVSILLGNGSNGVGNGTFQAAVPYTTGANSSAVVIGDFNGDGIPDLALTSQPSGGNPGNQVSLLLGVANSAGKASGTFAAPAFFGVGYYSSPNPPKSGDFVAIGDFNLDGALDLAVANSGSNTVSVLLNLQGTAIKVTPTPTLTTYGQSLTLTAAVAASVSNGAAPTGSVTFMNGNTKIGTAQTLSNGQASISTSTLPAGTSLLSAVYSGDSNYQAHTVSLSQAVSAASSATSLQSSPNPAAPNQTITFTASVNSPQSTGTVTFLNGSTSIGSGTLNAGQATLTTSSLAMGTSNITAVYSGNSNVTGSSSSVLEQVVGKASTTTVLTSNPAAANLNQSVTFTATVSGAGGVPAGTVTFSNGTTQLGTGTLNSSGVATVTTSSLAAGANNVSASYAGNSDFLSSTSSVTVMVTGPGFGLTANGLTPGSISPGATATSTVTVTPAGGFNPSTVNLTCTVSPNSSPAPTCSFGSITVTNGVGKATLTFKTAGSTSASLAPIDNRGPSVLFAVGIVIPAMLLGGVGLNKPGRKKLMSFCLFLALAGCMAHMGCGGGSGSTTPSGNSGTPAGSYNVVVSGSATGVSSPAPVNLSVTVQ